LNPAKNPKEIIKINNSAPLIPTQHSDMAVISSQNKEKHQRNHCHPAQNQPKSGGTMQPGKSQ